MTPGTLERKVTESLPLSWQVRYRLVQFLFSIQRKVINSGASSRLFSTGKITPAWVQSLHPYQRLSCYAFSDMLTRFTDNRLMLCVRARMVPCRKAISAMTCGCTSPKNTESYNSSLIRIDITADNRLNLSHKIASCSRASFCFMWKTWPPLPLSESWLRKFCKVYGW